MRFGCRLLHHTRKKKEQRKEKMTTRRISDVFGLAALPPLASVSHRSRRSEIGLKSTMVSSSSSSSSSAVVEVLDFSFSATASDEPSLKSNDGSSSTASSAESCESLTTTPVDDNRVQKKNVAKNDDDSKSSVSSSHKQGDDTAALPSSAALASFASSSGRQQSQSYFLQGIDFESCQDVMSLPDPPDTPADGGGGGDNAALLLLQKTTPLPVVRGPPSSSSTINILRRMSSPLVRPLRDSTNELTDVVVGGMDDSKVTTRKKNKRTRKTMFELSSSSSSSSAVAVTFSSGASNNDPSSVETTTTFSKRRKKRQSIVLPSDAAEMDDDEDSSSPTSRGFIKTFSTFKQESSSPKTGVSSSSTSTWAKDDVARIPSQPNAIVLAELRRLVHDYTDLPKAARAGSNAAKTIREMTGYTLTSTHVVDANNNDDNTPSVFSTGKSRQEKFALLQGMENDLRRLDATKLLDAQVVATVTQCRVQKVRGSGSFRYFMDQTGEPVTPQEYEMRYMLMLEEINRIRSKAWSSYFDQLEQDDCWKKVVPPVLENKDAQSDDDASGRDNGSVDVQSSSSPAACCPFDEEPRANGSQDDAQSNTSFQQPNVSPPMIDKQQVLQVDEDVEMEVVVDADAVLALLSPQPASPVFSEEEEDDDDDDPEMARAVQKLHDTMDRALATYAEEVMAIQAARAQKKMAHEGQTEASSH